MKLNMILGALVVSVSLVSQSFGLELLDRMLGVNSGACCEKPCCEVEPACCAPVAAKCCQPEPACCAPEAACCDTNPCCKRGGLLDHLFARRCCKPACEPVCEPVCCQPEPTCCEAAPCCKRGGLLDHLFARRCKTSCCDVAPSCGGCDSCGAGAPVAAPAPAGAAPMPPAPMADPSASLPSNRRLVRTTSLVK